MSDERKFLNDSQENACVVCFKIVEIYSIGECDHPVCYECSTRMRVLCQQNECPICRQGLSKVIFTKDKRSYRELEATNRSEYYNKKYKICFSDIIIQKAFYNLLEHPCPKCNCPPFPNFDALKDHVRKEHEHFYCDLCTEHLKIFSFERKCYNRQELGMHRRKGDLDGNTSHRGHPLCPYCDCRYLDRDELFRHSRREHYYCHFCDADGANQFYADYESLRKHFRAEHYLCEEGDCAAEQFTGVFRSDIDLRAHIANVHGKSMGKLLAKQARTLQLEITLGPRCRNNQQDQTIANLRRGNNEQYDGESIRSSSYVQNPPRVIDAKNEQEFPSLSGGGSSSSAVTLIRPTMSIHTKSYGPSGLARTKENFPALGGGSPDTGPNLPTNSKYSQPPVSAILKNTLNLPQPKTTSGSSMVIHVSNRPTNANSNFNSNATSGNTKKFSKDFPALPGSRSNQNSTLHDDFVPTNSNINFNSISAKHRSLVDDYVGLSQPNAAQKLTLVPKEQVKTAKKTVEQKPTVPKLTSNDFPALALGAPMPEVTWVKSQKLQDKENRKSKVAPAPVLNGFIFDSNQRQKNEQKDSQKQNTKQLNSDAESYSNYSQQNNRKDKKSVKANEKKPNDCKKIDMNATIAKKQQVIKEKKPDNNNETKQLNKNSSKSKERSVESSPEVEKCINEKDFPSLGGSVPPGFDIKPNGSNKQPPGFKSVTLNSVAKPQLTFESSLGEIYSIVPNHQYLPPPNSMKRNQELVTHFQNTLKYPEVVEEFRHISQKFREGFYRAVPYYEHCQAALREKFDEIFPELLVLLPDINKQQELYLVHSQNLKEQLSNGKKQKARSKLESKLEVCSTCKQIVLSGADMKSHRQSHTLENNFPVLHGSSSENVIASSSKK